MKRISWTITVALIVGLFLPVSAAQALSAGQLTCVKNQVIFEGRIAVATDAQGNIYAADGNLVRKVDAATGDTTIIAGNGARGFSGDGGLGINAKLNRPSGIAMLGTDLYIADYRNEKIRKVNLNTGVISTLAEIYNPISLAAYNGFIYTQSESGQIFKIAEDGSSTFFIQNDDYLFQTIAFDSAGNLYTTNTSQKKVFKVTPAGVKTTFAGTGTADYTGDGGLATTATFNEVKGIAIDSSNNVYISDTSAQVIRKVNASDGKISTFVTGVRAATIAFINSGTMIFGEEETEYVPGIGKIKSINMQTKAISTISGGSPFLYNGNSRISATQSGDGGLAKNARLGQPRGLYVDPTTNDVYITEANEMVIRKINAQSGIISLFAGSYDRSVGNNTNVQATQTTLAYPDSLVKGPDGNFYFSEGYPGENRVVRKVNANTGVISIVAGGGNETTEGGLAVNAKTLTPRNIAFDSSGNLYFGETATDSFQLARIRKVDTAGRIFTVAGGQNGVLSGDEGPATAARFQGPAALVIDLNDNLYFADYDFHVIRKINLSATTPTITRVAGGGSNEDLAFSGLATQAILRAPGYDGTLVIGVDGNLYWNEDSQWLGRKGVIRSLNTTTGNISTVIQGTGLAFGINSTNDLILGFMGAVFKFVQASNELSLIAGSPGALGFGHDQITNLKVGCNLVPQVAISVGSTPNSQVATIPSGATQAAIPATTELPAITLNFGGTAPTAVTVAPIASNPAAPATTPFKILGSTKIVDITPTGTFTGSATVCLDGLSTDSIFHFTGGQWVELPSRTYANGQVCGVTTSFSPFAAAEPQAITAPVVTAEAAARAAAEAARAAAEAAAAKREAEKQSARTEITINLKTAQSLTVDSFVKAEIPGITASNIAAFQTELLALPEASRMDINQVLKVARKFEVVGNIATESVKNLSPSLFVEIGLIPTASKNKVALVTAVRKLPASARDTYAEIKSAIDAEAAAIKARKDRLAAIIARNKARN